MPYSNTNIPNGDAFIVNTPQIDQMRTMLWQQQQQRANQQQRENALAQDQLARQLSNIRGADIGEFMDAYNKYKGIKQQLLFDPKVKHDVVAYNDLNNKATEALADVYKVADDSIMYKQMHKDLLTSHNAHPDIYSPDFGERINQFQNTPMSKLGDLADPDTYRFKDNLDFNKMDSVARGKAARVYASKQELPGGIETAVTPYSYGNNPEQYKKSMMLQIASKPNGQQAAANAMAHISPDQIALVNQEYAAENPDKWNKTTGQDKPMNIDPLNPNEAVDQYTSYMAKLNWLQSHPQEGKVEKVVNEAKKMQLQQTNRLEMQQNQFRHSNWMAQYNQGRVDQRQQRARDWNTLDDQDKTASIENGFKEQLSDAMKNNNPEVIPTAAGGTLTGYRIEPLTVVKKQLQYKDEKGHYEDPEMTLMDADGKNMIGVFTTTDKKGNVTVDDEKTKVVPVKSLIDPVRKELLGASKTGAGISGKKKTATQTTTPKAQVGPHGKSVKQNGVVYTWNPDTGQYE